MLELKDLINWGKLLKQTRSAGGHQEVMDNMFDGAKVLASYIEDDYQGKEGYVYKLQDGRIVLMNDYFGSCSGCDSWEDSSDKDARTLIIDLCNNAKIVDTIQEAIEYLEETQMESGTYYDWNSISGEMIKQLQQGDK